MGVSSMVVSSGTIVQSEKLKHTKTPGKKTKNKWPIQSYGPSIMPTKLCHNNVTDRGWQKNNSFDRVLALCLSHVPGS